MKKNLIFSALAIVAMWLIWIAAYFIVRNDYLLPSFWATCRELGRQLISAAFWRAFGGTLLRTFAAFAAALVLAVALASCSVLSDAVRAFFAPIVSVLRTVPTMAVILILLLWTSHAVAPVLVSLLVLFPALYAAMLAALDEAKENYGALCRAFKVGVSRKIFKLYLPAAAPPVLAQAGSILSMGLKITVSGEVLAQTFHSLGGAMQDAQLGLEIPRLFALTLLVVLLGFLLEGGCLLLSKCIVKWRE